MKDSEKKKYEALAWERIDLSLIYTDGVEVDDDESGVGGGPGYDNDWE